MNFYLLFIIIISFSIIIIPLPFLTRNKRSYLSFTIFIFVFFNLVFFILINNTFRRDGFYISVIHSTYLFILNILLLSYSIVQFFYFEKSRKFHSGLKLLFSIHNIKTHFHFNKRLTYIFLIFLIFIYLYSLGLIRVFIHEIGHIISINLFGSYYLMLRITLTLNGATYQTSSIILNQVQDIVISLSGFFMEIALGSFLLSILLKNKNQGIISKSTCLTISIIFFDQVGISFLISLILNIPSDLMTINSFLIDGYYFLLFLLIFYLIMALSMTIFFISRFKEEKNKKEILSIYFLGLIIYIFLIYILRYFPVYIIDLY